MGGVFTTSQKRLLDMSFPELNPHKKVTWICHIDSKTRPCNALYDVIIGMDMMTEIGMYVNTAERIVQWEENSTLLYHRGALNRKTLNNLYSLSMEASILKDAKQRQKRILEANYDKIDIDDYVATISTLNMEQQRLLARTLKSCPYLFKGGLNKLKIPPVHIELKEGAKPKKRTNSPITVPTDERQG